MKMTCSLNSAAAANVKQIEAEAAAKAELTQTEAEAKANEMVLASLNDTILKKMYLEKWDGKLPTTSVGDSSSDVIIDLP